jgi:hypothetical protein
MTPRGRVWTLQAHHRQTWLRSIGPKGPWPQAEVRWVTSHDNGNDLVDEQAWSLKRAEENVNRAPVQGQGRSVLLDALV